MIAEFTIHAPPTGKARPRVTSHGTYTPKKTKEYERLVQAEYKAQCPGMYFDKSALCVSIDAFYPIPKSASKAKKADMYNGNIQPTVKPDSDNVAKAICDALNGLAYHDDAQIVDLRVMKWYDVVPRCDVYILEV